MIGQEKLLQEINSLIQQDNLPRFIIIVGPEGSGKKLLAQYICTESNFFWTYEPDNKIDTIRKVIKDAYKVTVPTCYVFTDVDDMSQGSRNALLKVTEEAPNKAYFIMTCTNIEMVLPTIISRAQVFYMQPYTSEQLINYAYDIKDNFNANIVTELCETPGDVDLLFKIGEEELYEYTEKVVDYITEASLANALKIASKLAFKPEQAGYDVKLFLRAFKSVCGIRMKQALVDKDKETRVYYGKGVNVVSNTLNQLSITGINKSALFDMFILDIRREWEDDSNR